MHPYIYLVQGASKQGRAGQTGRQHTRQARQADALQIEMVNHLGN